MMTGAEFAAIRRGVGMTYAELAATLAVNERTCRSWEHGDAKVPDWVVDRMDKLLGSSVKHTRAMVAEFNGGPGKDGVPILIPRRDGWYAAAAARAVLEGVKFNWMEA